MSDCFSCGLACNSPHTCNRNGCQRKATGFDPVDHKARDTSMSRAAHATLKGLRDLLNDDGFAASCKTVAEYRVALLRRL